MIIDPPGDFATAAEWRRFLTEMKTLALKHPEDRTVQNAISEAEERLAELEN